MFRTIGFSAAILLMHATNAHAAGNAALGNPAVSDAELASIRGGASPFGPLTRGNLLATSNSYYQADTRFIGDVSQINMDIWWGTVGSELIAAAVRTSPLP